MSKICPQCGFIKSKSWAELSDEERLLVEKLPGNTEFSREERKSHKFCARCWHEFDCPAIDSGEKLA